jgi:nucleoside-diphosphate-sugar epimerase
VTGAAGFIGSTLVDHLLEKTDWLVRGVDSLTSYYDPEWKRANLAHLGRSRRFEFSELDLSTADTDVVVKDVDYVFHLAAQPGVRNSWGAAFDVYVKANVLATQRLLESSNCAGDIRRLVYASSSSVYGNARSYPVSEESLTVPLSPYGVTRLAAENLCALYAANFGLPTASLRFFTVYGPRQRPDMAFYRIMESALGDSEFLLFGDGEQIREFTFVDDIARACVLCARASVPAGLVMNLSGGASVSMNLVIEQIERIHRRGIRMSRKKPQAGDVERRGGTTDRAESWLGWRPEVTFEEGLSRQYEWMQRVIGRRGGRRASG